MRNKLLILIFIAVLLNISLINAADNAVLSHEVVQDADNTIKVLFLSWGEGLATTIDLDEYFPVKRDENTQYLYLSPKEILVSIDQATGVATLKESKGWIGSKEVYFSISDVYHVYETQTALRKYVEKIQKERESETIKTNLVEFKDSSLYPYLDSLLNKLDSEKSSTEVSEIRVTFQKPDLKIDVGSNINFNIGVKTKTSEGVKTYLPYLILNIKPEKQVLELEQAGFSFWILAPLIIIILVLAVILYFYIKDNIPLIKKFINKIIPAKKKTRVDVLSQDVKDLKFFSLELQKLSNQIGKVGEDTLSEKYFDITKKVFNSLTHPSYEFTYAEINKEILAEDLNDDLKNQLLNFSKELSDLRFSGERISKPEIKQLIQKTQYFIEKAVNSKQKSKVRENIRLIQKTPWIKYLNSIKSFFKEKEVTPKREELKIKKEEIKERKKEINLIKNIFHTIGLFKTEAEKLKELQKKRELELKKRREKEYKLKTKKELKLQKKRERREKIKKFFRSIGLFKTEAEKLKELQKKRELELQKKREKEYIKREKIRSIKRFFHILGLFKTEAEKLREEKEKQRLGLEKKRIKDLKEKEHERIRRGRVSLIRNFLQGFGLLKTEAEKLKELQKKRELELKKRREKEYKLKTKKELKLQKKRERREKIKKFFHNLRLFKTIEEKREEFQAKRELVLKKRREEERKRLEKEREIREKKALILQKRRERRERIKRFFHNIGLFRTEAEKLREIQKKRELILKKKREEERKRLEKEKELQKKRELELKKRREKEYKLKTKKELRLQKKRERREKIKKFFHNIGLFKTTEEKNKEKIEKHIKKIEEKNKLKRNLFDKINSFFRFIIKKRKLTPAEELQILMRLERQALASRDTQKAYEIDKKISQLYREIQKKPSLIDKEIHEAYKKLKDEIKLIEQKVSQARPHIELHKPKIGFLDNFRKTFSQQLEKPKVDEIRLLVRKIESQFELKSPDNQKISEYFLRANAIYKTLNNISKNNITQELLRIKNKIGVIAVKSAIEKAETALKDNQLKKAEEIYNSLNKTYYDLPLKEREKLHEKRIIIQQKLKPLPVIQQKQEKIKKPLFNFSLFRPKSMQKPLLSSSLQKDIEKIKEKVIEKLEKKVPEKKEFEIRQSFKDYLTAKKPEFPAIQTFLTKKEAENKQASEILNVIKDIYNYLSKKQYEKAKNTYLEAIKLFKELPDDIPSEIRDNIYHKLIPLKKQILDSSLQGSLQKAKEAVMTGKIKDAKEHHQIASRIYTHLASNTDVFIPGPITLKEKELENLIQKANDLIKSNKIKELKEIYTKINEIYNELPPFKKQIYYNKVSVIYNEIIKK